MIGIFCTSRSRSSLVAGAFTACGGYSGISGSTHGYVTYEDVRIKKLLREAGRGNWVKNLVQPYATFGQDVADIFPKGRPWIIKCSVEFFPVLKAGFPNMLNVFVHRRQKDVVDSVLAKRSGDRALVEDITQWRMQTMWRLNEQYGGCWVHTTDIDNDFWYSLEEAIEYAGLRFDKEAVEAIITRKP